MKKNSEKKSKLNITLFLSLICVIFISAAASLVNYLLQLNSSVQYEYYFNKYKAGMICEDSFSVPDDIDIIDAKATDELKQKNASSVLPVFVLSIDKTSEIISKLDSFRSAVDLNDSYLIKNIAGSQLYGLVKDNLSVKDVSLAYEIASKILKEGYFAGSDLSSVSKKHNHICVLNSLKEDKGEYSLPIDENLITDKNIADKVDLMIVDYEGKVLDLADMYVVQSIVQTFCEPNVAYDEMLTNSRIKSAYDNTAPVVLSYKKGQPVLVVDKVITQQQMDLLYSLGNRKSVPLVDFISSVVLTFIGFCIIYSILYVLTRNESLHRNQIVVITSIFALMVIAVTFFALVWGISHNIKFYDVLLPMCFLPLGMTMLSGRKVIGFVCVCITAFLSTILPGTSYYNVFYVALCGVACCFSVQFMNRRLDMFKQSLIHLGTNLVLTVLFMVMKSISLKDMYIELIVCVINVLATNLLLIILVPVIERIFNIPTVFRLHELAYGDSPLLKKLLQAAPGTYNHSHNVADLAEGACNAIGANALLARVGALYHDIGKIEYPEYYVENQSGDNKHDDINPSLSVSIIKNHVKVGADNGREAGLPMEVIDIIANHHGNDVISYFYNEAKKQADDEQNVNSIDFSYNNSDIPKTKECAVVMLADGVEAAARTVSDPTPAKFTKLINSIVFGKIDRGQLDDCPISLKEINVVCESFLKTLSAIHHSRIEYPDEDKK